MEILTWIQDWYKNQCNGSWEHSYGLTIESLDNPGWQVKIDLSDTELEGIVMEYRLTENSDSDWYGLKIENNIYQAVGDPDKLELLLEKFKEIVISERESI